MNIKRIFRHLLSVSLSVSSLAIAAQGVAQAAPATVDNEVRIGLLTDMNGPYSSVQGKGSVAAAEMAISDFGGTILGKPIKLLVADNKNNPELSSGIARRWIDQDHVSLLTGLGASSVALAVQSLAKEKNILTIATGSGATELTGKQCSPLGIRYTYSTHALAAGTTKAILQTGGKKWFFIAVDYTYGRSMVTNATKLIEADGGQVLGAVYYPLGTTDFSSYVLQAQQSGANVVAFATAGADTVSAIKGAHEFGLTSSGQKLVGMLVLRNDVEALGRDVATGLEFTVPWYENRTSEAAAWAVRFHEKRGQAPNWNNAGLYSAITTYLTAVKNAGTLDARSVRKELGSMKINDIFVSDGHIAPNGVMLHDMYLVRVNPPKDKALMSLVKAVPAAQSFIAPAASGCPLTPES